MARILSGMAGRKDLTSGSLGGNLLRLAAPIAASMMLHGLYEIVDARWLGQLSTEALAAPGVCMPFFFVVIMFAVGFGAAGTALVSQHTGAGRRGDADRAAGQVLLVLCVLATVLAVPMCLFAPQLLALSRVPPDVAARAVPYMRILMPGLPLIAFAIGYGSILRALGDTVTVLVIGVFTNGLNMILDPLLIFGWAGFPALGVKGAAVATIISRSLGAVACCVLLLRRHAGLHITLGDLKPDWPVIRKTFAIGLPMAISNSSTSVGFVVFQAMINSLGTAVIGAFTIGFRVLHFFNVPTHAMAMAAAPVVGQALGAGKPKLARRAVLVSAGLVAGVLIVPLACLVWQREAVARLFAPDPSVIQEAGKFFLIVPASAYFFGVLMVLMAAFYGSGHTRPAMVVSIVRLWVLRLPAAYLMGFVWNLGSLGVYAGMVFGNILSALLAFLLFQSGGWQSAVVPTKAEKPPGTETTGLR